MLLKSLTQSKIQNGFLQVTEFSFRGRTYRSNLVRALREKV